MRGRLAVAAVAVLALVFSLAGMSVLLARDALPGDTLYGIKRSAEAASLALTFGEQSKAIKHLEYAAGRIDEIETLVRRHPDRSTAPSAGYLTALTDFDTDAAAGSRKIILLATPTDSALLESLRVWAGQQTLRLTAVSGHLPTAVTGRNDASLALLERITDRAAALLERVSCAKLTAESSDDLGGLPATSGCERRPGVVDSSIQRSTGPSGPPTGGSAAITTQPAEPSPSQPVPVLPVPPPPAVVLPSVTSTPAPTIVVPLPLPTVTIPPVLPGLPGVTIGG